MSHHSYRNAQPCVSHVAPSHRRRGGTGNLDRDDAQEHCLSASDTPQYLNNDEAAAFLRLSPRTLEKQRVIGGGPRFRKFGRRVMYAQADLLAWADARCFETTFDPEYLAHHQGAARDEL
ncbi:helix-turn-helix transcriptional regulator [Stutzerimonas zhaodongensis]|uniref:helix-turn-helix transcriptional regulator n=1 Tax=Stutzerimonas zhaodongensis TaxID=1176257 RepID=UPI0039EF4F15